MKARTTTTRDSGLIERLSKDWLERDGDSFVHIRKTGRLGWEATLEKGTPYSSYLLDSPSMEELIRRAYPMARQTISAMDTPFKVGVRLSADRSCTEGKNVYVATEYFDNKALSAGEKLDIFLGLTAHEGSHLLYTQFEQMGNAAAVHPLCGNLLNIIEDERIERLLGEEKPGLANYLKAVKEYYFGKYASRHEGSEDERLSRLERIVNCILGLVRYPRLLRESDMMEFGELLLKVEDILTPYPATTAEAERAAEKIFNLIRESYEEAGKASSDGKDGTEGKEGKDGTEGKKTSRDSAPGDGDSAKGGGAHAPCRGDGTEPGKSDGEKAKTDMVGDMSRINKDYKNMAESLESVAGGPVQPGGKGCGRLKSSDMADALMKDHGLLADICEGTIELGQERNVHFRKATENAAAYNRALAEVRQYVPAIRRAVKGHSKDYKLVHMGMRSGLLDTNKLAEAIQGAPAVYMRNGEVKSDRATVCVLVDESGSMIREGRMTAARQTAVLLNEALSGIPNIELFFYGHSADETASGITDMRVYREKNFAPRYALGSLDSRDNNRDGTAILETATRVRRQTDNEVLMFVLSDGAPEAQNYIGREAIAHTKACVEKAEAMGFHIVQICINATYDPATMFRHHVKLENLSTLAHDLGRIIAKTLTERIKTTVR